MSPEEIIKRQQILEDLKSKIPEEVRSILKKRVDLDLTNVDDSEIEAFDRSLQPTIKLLSDNIDIDFNSRWLVWYYFMPNKMHLPRTPNKHDNPLLHHYFINEIRLDYKKIYTVDDILAYLDKEIREYRLKGICGNMDIVNSMRAQDDVRKIVQVELLSTNLWSFMFY